MIKFKHIYILFKNIIKTRIYKKRISEKRLHKILRYLYETCREYKNRPPKENVKKKYFLRYYLMDVPLVFYFIKIKKYRKLKADEIFKNEQYINGRFHVFVSGKNKK